MDQCGFAQRPLVQPETDPVEMQQNAEKSIAFSRFLIKKDGWAQNPPVS